MTREEALNKAIAILTYNQVNFCKSKEAVANMNEIIDALEKIDQEPCDDAVSRQAVLEILNDAYFLKLDDGAALQESVNQLPSVTAQPKVGQWKRISMDMYVQHAMAYYECSECGKKMIGTHNYCPNCGAKMSEIPTGAEGSDKCE